MTKNKNNEKEERRGDWMVSSDMYYHASEWFGAIFFYLIKFGRTKFNKIYSKSHRKKNVIAGYIIQIIVFFSIMGIAFYLYG